MSENTQSTPVSVLFYYDGEQQYAHPVRLFWQKKEYELGGVQFWYSQTKNKKLVHRYTVSDKQGDYTFQLSLETENLTWALDEATATQAEEKIERAPAFARFTIGGAYA
jgi:hypothetical protein